MESTITPYARQLVETHADIDALISIALEDCSKGNYSKVIYYMEKVEHLHNQLAQRAHALRAHIQKNYCRNVLLADDTRHISALMASTGCSEAEALEAFYNLIP